MKTTTQFEEVTVCPYCSQPTKEMMLGDEGFTFCSDGCGCLEGEKTVYKLVCKKCDQICDLEKCDCNK